MSFLSWVVALILKKTSSPSWDLTFKLSCSVPGAGSVMFGWLGGFIKEGVKILYSIRIIGRLYSRKLSKSIESHSFLYGDLF